jgi:hypothetical protein
MTRAEFYDSSFKNYNFLAVDLAASDFSTCELKRTKFFKSNLGLIGVDNVEVWELEEWVEIEDFSRFEKHLDESKQKFKIRTLRINIKFSRVQLSIILKPLFFSSPKNSNLLD